MTQNDISFYNAKKTAQDNRLRRRETKRHNKQMEALEALNTQANITGAQARMLGAQASAQSAATNQAKYELEWEKEYGWNYGTPKDVMMDPNNYAYLDNDPSTGIMVPVQNKTGYRGVIATPQTYNNEIERQRQIRETVKKTSREAVKTIFDIFKEGADTVRIVEQVVTEQEETLNEAKDKQKV